MVLPVEYRLDRKLWTWFIYDKHDVIVAEGLTKCDVILTCKALNYIEEATENNNNNNNKGNNVNEINT